MGRNNVEEYRKVPVLLTWLLKNCTMAGMFVLHLESLVEEQMVGFNMDFFFCNFILSTQYDNTVWETFFGY